MGKVAVDKGTKGLLRALGPGLLMAGAAIGVSHLVQSTRAGASYGYGLIWAVVLANIFKYPFLEFGPRYAAATGDNLLEGYKKVGRWALWVFLLFTIGTMFTVQAAVTAVTAGIAAQLTGLHFGAIGWSAIILVICIALLWSGQYPLLDTSMKVIMAVLVVSTIVAVFAALGQGHAASTPVMPPSIWNAAGITFLLALMGWMPIPIDASVWHSLWTQERTRQTNYRPTTQQSLIDFNIGYFAAAGLALLFLLLGAFVMYGSNEQFADSGAAFAGQLINLYTRNLGAWSYPVIGLAAFTCMFSTTLTVVDAYPRVMDKTLQVMFPDQMPSKSKRLYLILLVAIPIISIGVLALLGSSFTFLVDVATILSFLTAPLLGYINHRTIYNTDVPENAQPKGWLFVLSWAGIIFLTGFALLFLLWRLFF